MSLDQEEALRYLEKGNESHRQGDIEGAVENYRKSIQLHPTAEAHTFLGWMYSFQGRIEAAIQECKTAIAVDPDFGNPYNDIGVYLMQQGRMDEAEPWFRQAIQAVRYEPRHFPHLNLGRIHLARREFGKALAEFRKAAERAPEDPVAVAAFRDLVSKLN